MSPLAHVAGVPVEEGLLALGPAALAFGAMAAAHLRHPAERVWQALRRPRQR